MVNSKECNETAASEETIVSDQAEQSIGLAENADIYAILRPSPDNDARAAEDLTGEECSAYKLGRIYAKRPYTASLFTYRP